MSAVFLCAEMKGGRTMTVFTGSEHKRKTQKERIKEITEQLEAGVTAVFESDAYKAYLKCMSNNKMKKNT